MLRWKKMWSSLSMMTGGFVSLVVDDKKKILPSLDVMHNVTKYFTIDRQIVCS